jgi:hypothetical protein
MSSSTQRTAQQPPAALENGRVADRFFAIAHDAWSARPYLRADQLAVGLSAGLLAELMLGGFLTLTPGGTLRPALPHPTTAPSDATTDRVLRLVRAEPWGLARMWLEFLSRSARGRVVDRLAGAGVLWRTPSRRGPYPRRSWYPAVPEVVAAEPRRLANRLALAESSASHTAVLFRTEPQPAGASDHSRRSVEQRQAIRDAVRSTLTTADLVLAALVDRTGLARTADRVSPVSLAAPYWLWEAVPPPYQRLVGHAQHAIETAPRRHLG